jgi:F0F1-type ATP synthase delta subunit
MKKADLYAHAFLQSVAAATADVAITRLASLTDLVEKKEGAPFMAKVRRAIHRALDKKERAITAHITLANQKELSTHADAIARVLAECSATHAPQKVVIDPTLISGFTVFYNGVVVDHSAKRTLLSLYSSLTA